MGTREPPAIRQWSDTFAPSLDDIEVLARDAWRTVPTEFRKLCDGLQFRVEEFASDEVLDALDIEDPFELMGLYQGISLDKQSSGDLPRGPDMVVLYRRAILDYWAEGTESLGHIVTHVLIHEVGHHFGFSDDDMERIEQDVRG